jgi:uncharacterized membrane protein
MAIESLLTCELKTLRHSVLIFLLLWGCSETTSTASPVQQTEASGGEFFKAQILPIFATRCRSCHNATLKISGLNLESAAGFKSGGLHGPAVMPGNPQQSRLFRRVARTEKPYMPMDGDALPEAEVTLLKRWIEQGAVWPEEGASTSATSAPQSTSQQELQTLSANAKLFKEKVHPILSTRCGSCHNEERKYSGFTLETRAGFLGGGWHGPVIVAGKPEESRLYGGGSLENVHAAGC